MVFKKLYKKAVSWHKYIGIFMSIILIWMSFSGILLNHPDLIAKYSVSSSYFTTDYIPHNWNRGGIRDVVYHKNNIYIGGKFGVWKSVDHGKSFQSIMENGFTTKPYHQKVNDLYLDATKNIIYAATFGGLYQYISAFGQGLLSLTSPNGNTFYSFPKEIELDYQLPLWNYMFELHNGRLFQFLFDKYSILIIPVLGLLFMILLITGLYEYLYRKRKTIKSICKF